MTTMRSPPIGETTVDLNLGRLLLKSKLSSGLKRKKERIQKYFPFIMSNKREKMTFPIKFSKQNILQR